MLGRRLQLNIVGDGRPAAGGSRRRLGRGQPAVNGSAASGPAGTGTSLTAQPATSSIIYTASVTVRATNLTRAASQATQLARAAGGYVSSENTALNRAHPDRSTISLQLKIPVSAYPATLGALSSQLGTRLAMSQHAQDVTQTVADVTSRVTSAQAAISQLRALLRHAGSVSSLLTVQNQINDQESSLESLLAQQRALTHETSFATVTMLLVASPHAQHHCQAPCRRRLRGRPEGRLARPGPRGFRGPHRRRRRPPLRRARSRPRLPRLPHPPLVPPPSQCLRRHGAPNPASQP